MITLSKIIAEIVEKLGISRAGAGDLVLDLRRSGDVYFVPGHGWVLGVNDDDLITAEVAHINRSVEIFERPAFRRLVDGRHGIAVARVILTTRNLVRSAQVWRLQAADLCAMAI